MSIYDNSKCRCGDINAIKTKKLYQCCHDCIHHNHINISIKGDENCIDITKIDILRIVNTLNY